MRAIDIEFELNNEVDFFKIETPPAKLMRIIKFVVPANENSDIVNSIRNKAKELAGDSHIYTFAVIAVKNNFEIFIEVDKKEEYGPTEC